MSFGPTNRYLSLKIRNCWPMAKVGNTLFAELCVLGRWWRLRLISDSCASASAGEGLASREIELSPGEAMRQVAGPGHSSDGKSPEVEVLKLRALILEDEPADVELTLHSLRESGVDIVCDVVRTAKEFTELVQKNSYDVILADYKLPGWNGMESVQILRREGLDVPVILVSGALGELTAMECMKQGAADYILKDHLARLPGSVRRAIRETKLRQEHRQSQDDLARSNRDLEQFAYVASHDLQEPLRMVATYTQLLEERYGSKLDAEANRYIHYAVDGALRMQKLVQDLLAFSRVGRQGETLESTDCNLVLQVALENLDAARKESGAIIQSCHLPVLIADRSQLVQVFQNLIGNAIKFRGSEPPWIQVRAELIGKEWVFSVA